MEENRKYLFGTDENKTFLSEIRKDLLDFGRAFPAPGGSAYWLGNDGTPWKDRNREIYETARMAHVYAIGTFLDDEGSLKLAKAALKGLSGEMHDQKNGGYYTGLLPDGTPMDKKLCYAHAFVILAASSCYLAKIDGARGLLTDALEVYDRFFWSEEEGLSRDTWNTEFTVCDSYRGLNANMHSVEGFLAAADVLGREDLRRRAGRIIDHVISWAEGNSWRIPEHYTSDWKMDLDCNKEKPDDQFKPYGATPGHGIEWARLIAQWALSSYGERTTDSMRADCLRYIEASEALFTRAVLDAWNQDGAPGICYTTDWDGKPVVHDRMHWTLAEAINTSAVLFRVTKKEIYGDYYAQFMRYLDEKVLDHVDGSWFHQLDRENRVIGTVWPGKPDLYHAFQATLIPYHDPSMSIAPAVMEGR